MPSVAQHPLFFDDDRPNSVYEILINWLFLQTENCLYSLYLERSKDFPEHNMPVPQKFTKIQLQYLSLSDRYQNDFCTAFSPESVKTSY